MPQVSVSEEDKQRFDELKPADSTHKEFFSSILRTYENADETVTIDTDAIVERVKHNVGPAIEQHAYRGVKEGLERND